MVFAHPFCMGQGVWLFLFRH